VQYYGTPFLSVRQKFSLVNGENIRHHQTNFSHAGLVHFNINPLKIQAIQGEKGLELLLTLSLPD
jgi:hypothetical protein